MDIKENKLFELRKDINMPGYYYRAGAKKTWKEWSSLFPDCIFGHSEWFIDLEAEKKKKPKKDELWHLVGSVFDEFDLHSISYKQAAVECCKRYAKILKIK